MNKSYTINHNCICTKNQELTEGNAYLYKEGSLRSRIVIEQVLENGEWLRLLVFFLHRSKTIEISHKNVDYVYSGMWRIFDLNNENEFFNDKTDFTKNNEPMLNKNQPEITKSNFLDSLSREKVEFIQLHFKTVYDCNKWGEHEKNLAYLSWLLGEGHLMISDHWMWHKIGDVEFNHKDYEITFESDILEGVNIEFTRNFYQLDKLYREVLKD